MRSLLAASIVTLLLSHGPVAAQCGAGEVEVTLEITTDDFGYESYWQLVEGTAPCGTSTIAEGGNLTIGCQGGGTGGSGAGGAPPMDGGPPPSCQK